MSAKATFRLTTASDALAKLLPTAEAEVMRVFWVRGSLKGRAVYEVIAAQRPVAYTTVMTVCVRLAEKGLLRRENARSGWGYVYTPMVGEHEFVSRELASILDSIVREYPSAIAHYLDTRREHAAV
jgi:predicted transcriptional regulator